MADQDPDARPRTDGPLQGADAPGQPHPDAATDAPATPGTVAQLLLTEVVLAPSTGELVEIANPGTAAVDLSTYYLSDSGNYFRLPAAIPTVDTGDFIARFPTGATIAPGAVITVALDTAASFTTVYGVAPTYALSGGPMITIVANGVPSLTNTGEPMVLFQWDGARDLVRDVDIVLVGIPASTNGLTSKSGVTIDGPDADTTATAYATDARTLAAQAATPAAGKSTKRIALEAGHEVQSGAGNGITGDDETSEDTAATWDATYTAPTPGTVPTGLLP